MQHYKIIVAHPGKQHSFRVASALKNNDMLFKYITTVYDKKSSVLMKIIKNKLSDSNLKRANGRKNLDLLENDVIQFCELGGFIEILLARYNKNRKLYNLWHKFNSDRFGKKVAYYAIKNNVDAVIMYDTNALMCFKILKEKAPEILRVMDVSAANRIYMKTIYESDFAKCHKFSRKLKGERNFLWEMNNYIRLEEEIKNTQFFLAPSNFVKQSLMYSGVKESNISICPYGANFKGTKIRKQVNFTEPIEAIYVGNVTAMKGIYYLLEAAKKVDVSRIHLTVVGAYDNSDGLLDPYMNFITFTGRVTHDEVERLLNKSDVFVFPSLGEGLSLSVLEAMACGLPCIVTKNSGANDAIVDYKNGFVVDIQDTDAIVEKLMWFDEHRELIPKMGENAVLSVNNFSWKNHEQKIIHAIKDKLSK
jgi:glycosyltransferase involved in cell wall biosynthesis